MNKKIILIVLIISLCFSFMIYKFYKKTKKENTEIYLIQVGAYKDYNNLSEATKNYDNYIIRKEGDLYKIYIGVTRDEEVYNKLVSLYSDGKENFKKVMKVTNEKFENNLIVYDNIIKNSENKSDISIVVKSSLKELENLLNKNE